MLLTGSHDTTLLVLSVLIAMAASFTALDLASRVRASSGWGRSAWLAMAAVAMGGGIWAMHFVAMLAFSLPGMEVGYDLGLTLLSLAVSVGATGLSFAVVSRNDRSPILVAASGLFMGLAIVAMHYIGMAAMKMAADISYAGAWVGASVLIAIGAATVAVWLSTRRSSLATRFGSAIVMGVAIAGMHYASMHGAAFTAQQHAEMRHGAGSLTQLTLAVAVTASTFLILFLTLAAALVDRRFAEFSEREAATLRRSEERFRTLYQLTPLPLHSLDGERRVENVTDAWLDLLGYPREEVLGRPLIDFMTEGSAGRFLALDWPRLLRDGQLHDIEYQFRTKRGEVVDVLASARAEGRLAGGTERILGGLTDITERKRAELRLQALNERLEEEVSKRTADRNLLWRLSSDIMLVADPDGLVAAVNPAWTSVLGWGEDDVVGRVVLDFFHPDDIGMARSRLAALRGGASLVTVDIRCPHKDGGWRCINWSAAIGDGMISAVGRDVTAEREQARALRIAEEALRRSQKMEAIGQLTGGVAHDFNNLLTVILGSAEELVETLDRSDEARALAETCLKAAERGTALTSRLLAFGRRQTLEPQVVRVGAVLSGVREMLDRTLGEQIELRLDCPPDLRRVMVDAAQLEDALLNLCINARDAMPAGGVLTIAAANLTVAHGARSEPGTPPGTYVVLTVSDTGTGMSKEVLGRAFEPFFTTKEVGQGSGLGLSMVYGFVTQSGGHAEITSRPGEGTSVRMMFPVADPAEGGDPAAGGVPSEGARDASPSKRGARVLVVEDDEMVRRHAASLLRGLGYQITLAADAAEAMALLGTGAPYDLLFSDVVMPGEMNGFELAEAARGMRPNIGVLLTSGYAEAAARESSTGVATPILKKPYRRRELAERVQAALDAG
ncbi:MHYT domain-containing protein [Roseomonas sp. CCTCC AB2023176]|uniref:MHYT domain-containing protein n=1 Tax=Roseomonas sp. CCTCC AB2023176 TaxID=3342640 RepID=UPI0035E35D8E